MKHLRILSSLFFACLFAMPSAFSQDITTQGTEFWVSFIGNGFKTRYDAWTGLSDTWLRIQLIVSAKRDCHCTIKNPNTGYEQSFSVEANIPYLFDNIPWEQAYMELDEHGQILSKGLCITADDTVSVYCANIAEVSFDASYILPTPALGNDYIIQTYSQSTNNNNVYSNFYTSAFLIVATEEGETTVDITPSVNTLDGHTAHNQYSITLRQGETYQVRSHNNYSGSRDLSGTRVSARRDCKKFAVFNGNNLTMVPNNGSDSDCIFEQAMPLTAWGRKFVVTASLGRENNDYVKITSAHDGNEILSNGNYLTTLNTGESITFELRRSDKSCFIEASQSCAVYLYNHSADDYGYGDGAPSMVWIAPIEQRINDITFSTFNYDSDDSGHDTDIDDHYVNIIVNAEDTHHVYLDNNLLSSSQFESVNGTSEYRFLRERIEHGAHHLSCANGFNAHVYGFGHAKGYAYLVGSKAADLSTTVFINDETVQQNDTISSCSLSPITFGAEINYQNFEVEWDFGDGTQHSHNITDQHIYDNYGLYEVTLIVTSEETPCQASSSITQTIYIDLYHVDDSDIYDNTCYRGPNTYTENGFNIPYDEPGIYEGSKILLSAHGCDSIVTMHLTVEEAFHKFIDTTACHSFIWAGTEYNIPGDYDDTKTFTTETGCDSIVTMHLVIFPVDSSTFTVPDYESCDSYFWNPMGHEILWTDHESNEYNVSGTYQRKYADRNGCDSLVTMHVDFHYKPEPSEIYPENNEAPHWVVTATEFQINSYKFYLKDLKEEPWDSVSWAFENPEVQWILERDTVPDNHGRWHCTMYVLNYIEDTIWISATPYNGCDKIGEKTQRYWFVCSFYGIDENGPSTGSGTFDFSIVPNPNKGEMDLHLEQLTGKVSIKVYDMRGALVDVIDTYNELDSKTLHYAMRDISSGIYFFVATAKEGTIAKKVVIE